MSERRLKRNIEKISPRWLVFLGGPVAITGISILAKQITFYGLSLSSQVFLRNLLAAIVMLCLIPSSFGRFKKADNRVKLEVIARSVFYTLAIYAAAYAFNTISLADVGILGSLPFISIIGVLMFKDKINLPKLSLILISLLGGSIISGFSPRGFQMGYLAVVAGNFMFALTYESINERVGHIDNEQFNTLTQVFSAIMISFITLFDGSFINMSTHINLQNFMIMIAMGILIIVNMLALGSEMKRISSIDSGVIMSLVPVIIILASTFLFNQPPSTKEIFGAAVIISSCIGLAYIEEKESRLKSSKK